MKYFIPHIFTYLLILINQYFLLNQIWLHSVHPEFGNYVKNIKVNNKLKVCEPWDYCPPTTIK